MPYVEENINVKAQKKKVFDLVSDVKEFPKFMDGVKDVRILEEGEGWSISEWITDADGRTIRWTEKDIHKPEEYRIDFELVKGDLKSFNGFWQLEDEGDEVKVIFAIDFEFGMPVIAPLIHPLLARILRKNMRQMLGAIKEELQN